MDYVLMNGDTEVLEFSFDDSYLRVLSNRFLPYELKDFVITTGAGNFKKSLGDLSVFRDYLANRTLNLSRENAKVILNVAALPQSLKTEERLKIVMACRGLSFTDNFWIKRTDEDLSFSDVDLRKRHLSEVSYDIAILGHHISATRDELCPDLVTGGMFPKYWHRENGTVYLYKSDKFGGSVNSVAEIQASKMIRDAGCFAIEYDKCTKVDTTGKERIFSVSRCITNEEESLVSAQAVKDWCSHIDSELLAQIQDRGLLASFANMVVADYVIANTDRHFDNWGFIVSNSNNEIKSFAPLYDLNQALVADEFDTNVDELIYEPTGKTFMQSVELYGRFSTLDFSNVEMSEKVKSRWIKVKGLLGRDTEPLSIFR